MSKNRKANGRRRGNARMGRKRATGRHRLNVRATSKRASRARWAIFSKRGFKVAGAVLLVIGLFIGVRRAVDHLLFESPKFKLSVVDYQTDGYLTRARVLEEAGVELGVNILRVDLEGVRERILERLPQVRDVEVVRDLPDRLAFDVEERHPVAWLGDTSRAGEPQKRRGGLLVDDQGVAMICERLEQRFVVLPVIYSEGFADARPGRALELQTELKAVDLVMAAREAFSTSPVELEWVRVANRYSLAGRLNTGAEITFGLEDFDRQLSDLRVLLAEATRRGRALATANLLVKKNIPVRFGNPPRPEPEPAPAAAPELLIASPPAASPVAQPAGQRRTVSRTRPAAGGGAADPAVRSILRVD